MMDLIQNKISNPDSERLHIALHVHPKSYI